MPPAAPVRTARSTPGAGRDGIPRTPVAFSVPPVDGDGTGGPPADAPGPPAATDQPTGGGAGSLLNTAPPISPPTVEKIAARIRLKKNPMIMPNIDRPSPANRWM